MLNEIKKDADARMQKSIASLQSELAKIRTGRAHPSLLEHIRVEYYGTDVPLNQAANISSEDARTLSVVPFDSSMVATIEKAIIGSRSEEHTSELQSRGHLVCRLLLDK